MSCPEPLRVQAYFDRELDAPGAAEIERHIESCPECRMLLHDLEETRQAIRGEFTAHGAPAALRARLVRALGAEPGGGRAPLGRPGALFGSRAFWLGALSGGGGALAAAALAALLWAPLASRSLLDSLLAEHVDSLLPGHLVSVESTDRHTVKPWFAGRADVSPVVEDFSAQGFPLIGGRADYLANQRAAVIVYQHGRHIINVFSWKYAANSPLRDATLSGYHLAFWRDGDLEYCAVSDAAWEDLRRLEGLLRELSARETPP
jgi:anti-sigma factor RsiW